MTKESEQNGTDMAGFQVEQERTVLKKALFLKYWEKSRGIVSVCCNKVGVGRTTFYNWVKCDHKFREELHRVEKMKDEEIEDCLMYKIFVEKDGPSVRFYLSRRHPDYIRGR